MAFISFVITFNFKSNVCLICFVVSLCMRYYDKLVNALHLYNACIALSFQGGTTNMLLSL